MNLSRRDQVLLAVLIVILIGCGFYLLVYAPINKEIQTFTKLNEELQTDKERLQAEIKKAPPKTAEERFANLDKRLPTEDEMIPLLTMLDETISKHNLPFASLDYKGAEKANETDAQTLVFTIGTKGKLILLLDFLNDLENAERLISVEDVSFNAVKAENVEKQETAVDPGPPTYYIAPPGIPEAKLQRIKFEVVEEKETTSATTTDSERPVAESFMPDNFEMKVTINAYYATPDKVAEDGNADAKKNDAKKTKGEV